MEAFRPALGKGRRFILGLDTLITGNIDELLNWRGECGLLTDPYETHTICNGIGLFSVQPKSNGFGISGNTEQMGESTTLTRTCLQRWLTFATSVLAQNV